jgi:hypothetical protein
MSQLLPILLSDRRSIADGAVGDIRITFADASESADTELRALLDKIDAKVSQLKKEIDALGGESLRDYVVATIENRGSDVTIQVLAGSKNPVESRRVLVEGDVVARSFGRTVSLETKFYEHFSIAKSQILQSYMSTLRSELPQPLDLYLIEDSTRDWTVSEQEVLARVRRMIGSEERAKAWFNYQPLPAFDNKTPRQLVDEGQLDAVLLHLDTLEDGVYA